MLTNLRHLLMPPKRLPQRLPYDLMVDDRTLFTKTGGLMWVANCVGLDVDAVDPATVDAYYDQLAELEGRLGDGLTIFHDQWKWRCNGNLPKVQSGNYAAHLIDEAERAQFTEARAFDKNLYIAFHFEPARAKRGLMEWGLGDDEAFSRGAIVRRFREDAEKFFCSLQMIMPRVTMLEGDALWTYLCQCVSYEPFDRTMPLLSVGLNWAAAGPKWRPGIRPMIGRNHMATVELYSLGSLTADTVRAIDQFDGECRWVVRVDTTARHQQAKWLTRMRAEYDQRRQNAWRRIIQHLSRAQEPDSDPAAAHQMNEADQLRVDVHLGDMGFSPMTMDLTFWDHDKEVVSQRALDAELLLKDRGFSAEKATVSAVTALLADIPGNDPQPREVPAAYQQIVRISPLAGVSRGPARDGKWNSPALLLGHSDNGVPIRWTWHGPGQKNGNSGIVGSSGFGKSALGAKMMAATIQKIPNSRVIVFDIGRSFMPTCLCLGGDWIELGDGTPAVQPLRHVDKPDQAILIYEWLLRALTFQGVPLGTDVKHAVSEAMKLTARLPIDERDMTAFVQRIGESLVVRDALSAFTRRGGRYGETFDSIVTSYGAARVVGVECSAIRKSSVLPLITSALFDALSYERLQLGHPSVIMFDEFHEFLKMPAFADEADRMCRQIRKFDGVMVFATQSPSDLTTQLAAVIDAQCENRIVTPNRNVLEENQARFYRELGYSDARIQDIATGIACADYYTKDGKKFRFRMEGDDARICGRARPRDIMKCFELKAAGVQPGEDFTRAWLEYTSQSLEQELAA